jgi:hypothetical protein
VHEVVAAGRRVLAPQDVDYLLPGHHLVRAQREQRQQASLLERADLDDPVGAPHLEAAEHTDVQRVATPLGALDHPTSTHHLVERSRSPVHSGGLFPKLTG